MKIFGKLILILLFLVTVLLGMVWYFFGPVINKDEPVVLTVAEDENKIDAVLKLKQQNLIRNGGLFLLVLNFAAGDRSIKAGGYKLNHQMNAWQLIKKITDNPDLIWVTIREGLRKEQIAEILKEALGWSDKQKQIWVDEQTTGKPEYVEGVYFPDTYLIPTDESGADIAKRMIANFNEKMKPLFPQFVQKDIKWTTGLKIASLIQREAGGTSDMPLISGIIWNRLDKGMRLEIDATLQYAKGEVNSQWWSHVDPEDKQIDSPFNTYLNKGLPPSPICNPGLAAIEAALNPAETDCLFYLHDKGRQIHCAKTYTEHLENIKKYL